MSLIEQERCEDVQLEQRTYSGKYCVECKGEESKAKPSKGGDKKKSKKKDKSKKAKDEL
jgi:hypothetical protein